MILVLAGTTEASQMVSLLGQKDWPAIASVTSGYGARLISGYNCEIIEGQLGKEQLSYLIEDKKISAVIDATHPFAQEISQIAIQVTAELKVPYIRLERPSLPLPEHPLIKTVGSLEQMEGYIKAGQTIFSTLGSKFLPLLASMANKKNARLIARVLPTKEAIRICAETGLQPEQIIAVKGPFSEALNKQLFIDYGADLIITKESGHTGGLDTKLQAAGNLNIPVLVWTRPSLDYPLISHSAEDVVCKLEGLWNKGTVLLFRK